MKIEEVKKAYVDEWIIAYVLKEDELNRVQEVKIIAHGKNKDKVYSNMKSVKDGAHITTFYTGEMFERDGLYLL